MFFIIIIIIITIKLSGPVIESLLKNFHEIAKIKWLGLNKPKSRKLSVANIS